MRLLTACITLMMAVTTANMSFERFLEKRAPQAVHVVSKEAHIDLTTRKVVHISGEIDERSVRRALQELHSTAQLKGDRLVIIDSPGGGLESGQKLLMALMVEGLVQQTRLICVVVDNAHSMAFNILSHCDVKLSTAGSTMVVHKAAYSALPMRGTAKNLRYMARILDIMDEPYRQRNAKVMHLDLKHYDMYADHENCWTAEQLIAIHYLDGIAKIVK